MKIKEIKIINLICFPALFSKQVVFIYAFKQHLIDT